MKNEEMDLYRNILLKALDHAIDNATGETREEAVKLTRMCFGENATNESPLFFLMFGFMMGFDEGMRINKMMSDGAVEKAQ